MNTERLHAIAVGVINDINTTKSESTLQQLTESLQNQVNQPQSPEFQQQVSQHLQTLENLLIDAPSNSFSPAWKQTLEELEIYNLLGLNLLTRIQEIFQRNQITPSVALEELRPLHQQLASCKTSLEQLIASFHQLNIGAEELPPGDCQIGVLVPRLAVNNKLDEFARDLTDLSNVFGAFSELTTGERPGFDIHSISSSDLSVFIETVPIVTVAIAFSIERVLAVYKKILEIRKLHKELKNTGVPSKELKGIVDYSNALMKDGIEQITKDLLGKYNDRQQRPELTTEIRFSLTKIAKRIDKGYGVEVRVQPLSDQEETAEEAGKTSEKAEHIKAALASSKNIEFLSIEGDPILTLPESEDVTEKKDTEKKKEQKD